MDLSGAYGVDIQPIACRIAKLRFFISLIVDQAIDPQEPNFGILPLPNLETKIVAANTLLGLQRGQLLLGSDEVLRLEDQLQRVRHDYFTTRRYKDKKALRAYLAYATSPRVILDFGDAPVFTSIAYPAIFVAQKTRHVSKKNKLPSPRGSTGILHPSNLPPEDWQSQVLTWSPGPALNDFPEIFDRQASALAQRDLKPDGWRRR